jgi:hypothetical protein
MLWITRKRRCWRNVHEETYYIMVSEVLKFIVRNGANENVVEPYKCIMMR